MAKICSGIVSYINHLKFYNPHTLPVLVDESLTAPPSVEVSSPATSQVLFLVYLSLYIPHI